ncbi:hypothetical protein HOY80DRAFT_1043705 [Tuber brumale]|nr:hypothetical protein HOY80DRAFT_1043705 [Tuber brumale]
MEDLVLTAGNLKITIKGSESSRKSGRRHRHRHGEDARAHHHTQQHHGTYSQNPAGSEEYAQGGGYPRLTAENLASHERQESSSYIPQAYRRQEDDTAAQCGQRYPEEHRHRRQRSDDTSAYAQRDRSTHHAAHHGHRQESGHYQAGYGYATEGGGSRGGYANQPPAQQHYHGVTYGGEYQHPQTHHAAYHQSDRLELGRERVGSSRPYREEGSQRRLTSGSSHSRDVPEWALYREGLANVEESEDGSIECEIEEAE